MADQVPGNILIQAGKKIERDVLRGRVLIDLGITSAEDYHPVTMAIIRHGRDYRLA